MLRILLVLYLLFAGAAATHWRPAAAQTTPSPVASTTTTPAPSGTPTSSPVSNPTTPAPARTPWPAPTNLRVTTVSRLLDDAGRPLPPEQQEHTDVLTWDHTPGSEGQYNVEVTLVPRGGGPGTVLQPYILFPADRGNGTIGRVSQYPEWLNYQRCYRIRITVPSGTGGIEVGPFGDAACTVMPTSSGPGATPKAPEAGAGAAPGSASGWPLPLGAAALALGAGCAGVALSRARGNPG